MRSVEWGAPTWPPPPPNARRARGTRARLDLTDSLTDSEGRAAVESRALAEFEAVMDRSAARMSRPGRVNLEQGDVKNGLGQLVLTLVKLLHELMERQAIRRMESGSLTETEVERLGVTLMRQAEEIERLRCAFHLEDEDLNLDLGPLGKLLS